MFWLVLGMTLAVALAAFVLGIVALPARRAGRFVLTDRGERLLRLADERPMRPRVRSGADGERSSAKRPKR